MISSGSMTKKEFKTHDEMIRDSVKGKGRQVGGNHYMNFAIMPIEYISKNKHVKTKNAKKFNKGSGNWSSHWQKYKHGINSF